MTKTCVSDTGQRGEMASLTRRYIFEFDEDEILLLLKLVGQESGVRVREMGLNPDVLNSVYAVLSIAAYAPMTEG